jgi:hypothetical protein
VDSSQVLLCPISRLWPIRWSLDGNWIYASNFYYQRFPDISKISVRDGKVDTLLHLPFENVRYVDITGDGDKIVCAIFETQSDIWLMVSFDPEIK